MPTAARKPCRHYPCPNLEPCPIHPKQAVSRWRHTQNSNERGYTYQWQLKRKAVLAEEPTCRLCPAPSTEVDHIKRKTDGGTDERDNLRALCHPCHKRITRRGQAQYRYGEQA